MSNHRRLLHDPSSALSISIHPDASRPHREDGWSQLVFSSLSASAVFVTPPSPWSCEPLVESVLPQSVKAHNHASPLPVLTGIPVVSIGDMARTQRYLRHKVQGWLVAEPGTVAYRLCTQLVRTHVNATSTERK